IGGWTTASVPATRALSATPAAGLDPTSQTGDFLQVSRLGAPLVNEVVIGLKDKNKFNGSEPKDDAQFADYVTNPTLPALLEALFGAAGVKAPTNFPRTDLVAAFLTGVDGLNKPANVVPSEMLRLNTAIPPTPRASQSRLGVLGGDNAGFPNGRRPGDDVVDIELRVAMGVLCTLNLGGCKPSDAPAGGLHYTDGAYVNANFFYIGYPYIVSPLPGSPDEDDAIKPVTSPSNNHPKQNHRQQVLDIRNGREPRKPIPSRKRHYHIIHHREHHDAVGDPAAYPHHAQPWNALRCNDVHGGDDQRHDPLQHHAERGHSRATVERGSTEQSARDDLQDAHRTHGSDE